MPTYQYVCTACEQPLEAQQSFSDDPLTVCPQCQGRLRKVFSAVGVVFKGSGFYRNDSRDSSGGGNGQDSGGEKSGEKTGEKTGDKSRDKSGDKSGDKTGDKTGAAPAVAGSGDKAAKTGRQSPADAGRAASSNTPSGSAA